MAYWTNDLGALIVDESGAAIECDTCPCDTLPTGTGTEPPFDTGTGTGTIIDISCDQCDAGPEAWWAIFSGGAESSPDPKDPGECNNCEDWNGLVAYLQYSTGCSWGKHGIPPCIKTGPSGPFVSFVGGIRMAYEMFTDKWFIEIDYPNIVSTGGARYEYVGNSDDFNCLGENLFIKVIEIVGDGKPCLHYPDSITISPAGL